jgi:EpsI family protein
MQIRALILSIVFVSCAGFLEVRGRSAPLPSREPLIGLPLTIGDWQGQAAPPMDPRVVAVLGADDYASRIYVDSQGRQAGLYIGFHATQRQGDSIHSPMNCLPGAGWLPIRSERLTVAYNGSQTATVNKVIIQKGESQQVVLYWYQSHGRTVASEYTAKALLFMDAVRTARTDAALVRVIVPVRSDVEHGAHDAQVGAAGLAESLFPLLSRFIPE